jgi:gallate decarboxylase subunit D
MKMARHAAKSGRFLLEALVQEIGEDLLVSIWGGTRPHIGALAMAVPRPSLEDPRRFGATSSNFTFTGHKEDLLVKEVSETIASSLRKNVVVTAGMHWEALKPRELAVVGRLARQLARKICRGSKHGSKQARRAP